MSDRHPVGAADAADLSVPTPAVVALGGGHGLSASLSALRRVVDDLTAIVTVADNGGSSGRLREEFGVLPPGDLRMALAALCGDDEWGRTWARVLQHRFRSEGEMHGHAVGNLLLVALWELLDEGIAGLDWVGRLLDARGRVLPMCLEPMDIAAQVSGLSPERPEEIRTVRGQVEVATTSGRIESIRLEPAQPTACPQAVDAIRTADWVVLGPGSWFTSVIPHLMVPGLRDALIRRDGGVVVVLNLAEQQGETDGYGPMDHIRVLLEHAPGVRISHVLADRAAADDHPELEREVAEVGARLWLEDLAEDGGAPRHDPEKLATAYARVLRTVG